MYSFMRSALLVAVGVIVAIGVTTLPSRAGDESKDLQSRIDKLEKKVTTLQAKLKYVSVEMDPINGLAGPHVIFEGCNVHVRSGSGSTNDAKAAPLGLGNLIVGYNEEPITAGPGRGGSHNLIVGPYHQYSSLAGVVFGSANTVSGFADTVTGGTENEASEDYTNVSGGARNIASGYASSVSGGDTNEASGPYSSVAGGGSNMASAYYSCVSGGYGNLVTNYYSSVSGGSTNTASGEFSSVSGGYFSTASGDYSSVSGGYINAASGTYSSVSGGGIRGAPGSEDWVAGGLLQDN
jgi:hypothetical protein